MTWRSLICFSAALFGVGLATLHAAQVSGSVQVRDSRVEAVVKRGDYSGIVVSLQPVGQPIPPPPAAHAVMVQKNKTFTPHVLPVLAGTTIDFPNYDPIFHNAFSSYSGQVFDVGLYPPGKTRSVRFVRPGVVRVFCNIHPSMSAIILVLPTPWFTKTSPDGSFSLDVPPGTYELNVFHERAPEQTLQSLSRRVIVTDQPQKLTPITVSEAGYLPVPHKNKYGQDYTAPANDNVLYPGVRN
jgi:plastocyanin